MNIYSNAIPSYFLTHPGTDERTRYIDALLHTTYTKSGTESIIGNLERIQTLLLLDGKTSEAANLQHFQKILNDNPGNVDALYGMAVTQDKLGMVRESLDTYRKALGLAPDDADILRDLGISLFKQAQFQDAALYLERASRLNENDPDTILYLGRTFEARGDMPKALGLYKKTRGKAPGRPGGPLHPGHGLRQGESDGGLPLLLRHLFQEKGETGKRPFSF